MNGLALPLKDDMLDIGALEYDNQCWMASVLTDGQVRWVLAEEDNGSFRSAVALDDSGFCTLIKRRETNDYSGNQTGKEETLLAFVSSKGVITITRLLAPYMEWMIPYGDRFFTVGNTYMEPDGPLGVKPRRRLR